MAETSFIENTNALANATSLATGDIVEDTNTAKDAAVAAAELSVEANNEAQLAEVLAKDWANKGHNNAVTGIGQDAEFSSYHWATEASLLAGDPVIDDLITSENYAWSSTKVTSELAAKSGTSHLHNGIYEPVISKNNAFNKSFTTSGGIMGTATSVARGDHTHNYEPTITTKNTAFNKNFGTTSGTVAEGSHTHSSLYMPLVTTGTAYNKNFVVNADIPLATEIPRGNHVHKASGLTYDSSGDEVISSSTVAGALGQLDTIVASVAIAEKTKLTAGMTDPTYTATVVTQSIPVVINAGMTVGGNSKNAIYSNGIRINYPADPEKFVEGNWEASLTVELLANKVYHIMPTVNGVVVDSKFLVEVGSADKTIVSAVPVSIGGFISGLSNDDVIGVAISNETDTTDIKVYSMFVSWAGQPEGALVASGVSVNHTDVTARDVDGQHPTSSIYETGNIGTSLDVLLAAKADNVETPVLDNLLAMDADGNIKDSGLSTVDVTDHMDKVPTPTLDNIVIMDSTGNSKDGGVGLNTLATLGGSITQVFNVGVAVNDEHAVRKGTFDSTISTLATGQSLTDHVNATNPHGVTYTEVGAAAASHTHTISEVTSLSDSLDTKYTKVVTPVTDNFVTFGAGSILLDSGINGTSTLLTGEAV